MDSDSSNSIAENPEPQDFANYFPYLCKCLQIPGNVTVCKQVQSGYVSATNMKSVKKLKHKLKDKYQIDLESNQEKSSPADRRVTLSQHSEEKICILAYFDVNDNLIQIRFSKNKQIPCTMFKLLALIIQYYDHFNSIDIDTGLSSHSLKELNNFLLLSHVTDIILDNSKVLDGDYYILLENKNLRQLSLRRCNLDDYQIEKIAFYLHYSEKCCKLITLNLASNKITDIGAKCLATALRSNRYLSHLNLCDNKITDEGGISILDCLIEFLLTVDEVISSKRRCFMYLKQRAHLIEMFMREIRIPDTKPKLVRKKSSTAQFKLTADKREKLDTGITEDDVIDESIKYDVAAAKTDKELGDFIDPFADKDTIVKNTLRYCKGNTKLCHLNLAYNDLTIVFVNKLIKVLKYQKSIVKRYTGLLRVIVEGNQLPKFENCVELQCAFELLQAAIDGCFYMKK